MKEYLLKEGARRLSLLQARILFACPDARSISDECTCGLSPKKRDGLDKLFDPLRTEDSRGPCTFQTRCRFDTCCKIAGRLLRACKTVLDGRDVTELVF